VFNNNKISTKKLKKKKFKKTTFGPPHRSLNRTLSIDQSTPPPTLTAATMNFTRSTSKYARRRTTRGPAGASRSVAVSKKQQRRGMLVPAATAPTVIRELEISNAPTGVAATVYYKILQIT